MYEIMSMLISVEHNSMKKNYQTIMKHGKHPLNIILNKCLKINSKNVNERLLIPPDHNS